MSNLQPELEKNGEKAELAAIFLKKNREPSALSSWLSGIGLVVLPLAVTVMFGVSTFQIAQSPATNWWVDLCILVGATLLILPTKRISEKQRRVIEITIWVAAFALLLTKYILVGIPT